MRRSIEARIEWGKTLAEETVRPRKDREVEAETGAETEAEIGEAQEEDPDQLQEGGTEGGVGEDLGPQVAVHLMTIQSKWLLCLTFMFHLSLTSSNLYSRFRYFFKNHRHPNRQHDQCDTCSSGTLVWHGHVGVATTIQTGEEAEGEGTTITTIAAGIGTQTTSRTDLDCTILTQGLHREVYGTKIKPKIRTEARVLVVKCE